MDGPAASDTLAGELRRELLRVGERLSFRQIVHGTGFGRNAWQAAVRKAESTADFR